MIKEIKNLLFLSIIIIFLFFNGKYYFSDENKKNSFRSFNNISNKIEKFEKKLPILENNTTNIIEYIEQTSSKKKKI
tara:strand:- start:184 stop:414 length:231 start_codon:yes stop_codon:yes gene_type:complete